MSALQELREQMKYSQEDFAKILGVSQPSLSNYEAGHGLSVKTAYRLIRLLKRKFKQELTLEDFFPADKF